jgi:gluconate 2-dehydrogenase gamma chain
VTANRTMHATFVHRRAFLHSLAQGGLALALLPGAAAAAWRAVAEAVPSAPARILGTAHSELIAAVADAILPRSDTPSATDVGVVQWIDTVAADYFSSAQRAGFLGGLAAIDAQAHSMAGAALASLRPGSLAGVITALDASCGNPVDPAQKGYVQLKELIIYGYFTSKPLQQDILQVPVIPGHFDPSVRITPSVK